MLKYKLKKREKGGKNMKRFPNHARVVFIGDSITAGGIWIAHVYDHYLKNFPDADIRMYNTGISGGSVKSALLYFEKNIMRYDPTHAVIMLGMNDVGRSRYLVDEAGDHIDKDTAGWQESLTVYEQGMRELIDRLQSRNISITLITPTCYDESSRPRALDAVGCDAALEYMGEMCRRLAEEYGADFVNFHAPVRYLNAAKNIIREDRVHPLEAGHVFMAHLFLAAQGLVPCPTLASFNNLPAFDDLLPVNQKRYDAERIIRTLWNAEWLLLRQQPEDPQARKAFMEAYEGPSPFWNNMRDQYLRYAQDLDRVVAQELACVEACLRP